MNYRSVMRVLGLMMQLFSVSMLVPMLISIVYHDDTTLVFFDAFVATLALGLLIWFPNRNQTASLRAREGFLITALFWLTLAAVGALPFYLLPDELALSLVDAYFEAMSAMTTTGATVMSNLEAYPESLLWYRQQLQFMGGGGIIILAVAVLPLLGVGGMQLYRSEAPGPIKDQKLSPRIAQTAKLLWGVYFFLTLACIVAYLIAGMSLFDAVTHAFSTISTGGFSVHSASIGHFDSVAIEVITIVFMLLGACNFGLHFIVWQKRSLKRYWRDAEFRTVLIVAVAISLLFTAVLVIHHTQTFATALRQSAFQVVSMMTSTGYATASFSDWPAGLPMLVLLVGVLGGCAGSTSGGFKMIRIMVMSKQSLREMKKMLHPRAIVPLRIGKRPLPRGAAEAVWGFLAIYTLCFAAILTAILLTGVDFITAWSVVASALNNTGPGLGEASASWATLPSLAKWILSIAMLLGRLELFTLLILFTPFFWLQR
ncbi:TrkH family potassium uptake protein [Salinibius halmophilus]|uniref:TrkH family potassium uptake protein n=1 Tax=Salinibius halmophilus TaxID=1853216 RepID=UPI000E66CEE8|nr:TrkH family potassium uptake protein [Salinibius halmophilus]